MIAMVVFILFMSSEVKDAVSGAVVGNVINKDWTRQRDDYSYYCWFVSRRCI